MIKITASEVTPFGGIHLVHYQILRSKFHQLIASELGQRSPNAVYSYADLVLNLCYTVFCGGDCAEDNNYLKDTFKHLKGFKVPSPDTLLTMQKELSTPAEVIISDKGSVNKININETLNRFLIKTILHFGVLNTEATDYCLDFDHQFIPTEKYDATRSYKKQNGYFPGVATINNTPVYFENRNGNCNVQFRQQDTLKRILAHLEQNGIRPARCRMDSGSYIKEVCEYLDTKGITFYIRADQSETLLLEASSSDNWKQCRIGTNHYEVCSIKHKFGKGAYRIVAYRWPNKTGQTRWLTSDANDYLFIITNDEQWDEQAIIEFYNQRGNSERVFDIQNNDFNWKKMPFSFLEENTVYLILMAICHVLYKWLIGIFSKAYSFLKPGHRLKKFTFRLICIAAKVTRSGRRQVVHLFAGRNLNISINQNSS